MSAVAVDKQVVNFVILAVTTPVVVIPTIYLLTQMKSMIYTRE